VADQADANKDEKISPQELAALAGKWWVEWSGGQGGSLTEQQIAEGLVKSFPLPPGFGGPGGPGGPPPGLKP